MCTYQIALHVDTSDAGDVDRDKLAAAVSEIARLAALHGLDITAQANAPEPTYHMVAFGAIEEDVALFKLSVGAIPWAKIL
jgi:hypothetical protein